MEINKDKLIKIVKIASIKAEIDDDLSNKLSLLFETVMNRKIEIDTKETKQQNIEYADAIFSIDEQLSTTKIFSSFIYSNYGSIKENYTKSTQVLKTANSTIDKLNPIKYRNK